MCQLQLVLKYIISWRFAENIVLMLQDQCLKNPGWESYHSQVNNHCLSFSVFLQSLSVCLAVCFSLSVYLSVSHSVLVCLSLLPCLVVPLSLSIIYLFLYTVLFSFLFPPSLSLNVCMYVCNVCLSDWT